MRVRSFVIIAGLFTPAAMFAQQTPRKGGRIAGIAKPPEPIIVPVTVPPPGQFLYSSVPVLVTPDGRVFADFGRGYEQLVRNCSTPLANYQNYQNYQPLTQPPEVTQPVAVQPQSYPPYTQPVPNQQTASQQMAQVANLPRATVMNSQSCWSTDTRGQVMVGK